MGYSGIYLETLVFAIWSWRVFLFLPKMGSRLKPRLQIMTVWAILRSMHCSRLRRSPSSFTIIILPQRQPLVCPEEKREMVVKIIQATRLSIKQLARWG